MMAPLLSIVIPCFNEERTIAAVLDRVVAADTPGYEKEIIVVDDGSTDQSVIAVRQYVSNHAQDIALLELGINQGKGAAIRAGFVAARGDIFLVQDADLEYNPDEYARLLQPFENPDVHVVYGSRILGSKNRSYNRYYWGGRLVTLFTNLLYGTHITDEPTGYKLFRRHVAVQFDLNSHGFEFCPEVTAKALRLGFRIHEVPISYAPRSFEEGKKIRWRDGVIALLTLLRYRFWKPSPRGLAGDTQSG